MENAGLLVQDIGTSVGRICGNSMQRLSELLLGEAWPLPCVISFHQETQPESVAAGAVMCQFHVWCANTTRWVESGSAPIYHRIVATGSQHRTSCPSHAVCFHHLPLKRFEWDVSRLIWWHIASQRNSRSNLDPAHLLHDWSFLFPVI